MSDLPIPVVDLDDLASDGDRRARAVAALVEGYGRYGLVFVSGHGLSSDDLEGTFAAFREVTDRPEDAKRESLRPDIWFQRGWTPPNTERAVVAGGQPDFKECWFAAPRPTDPEGAATHPELFADNVWPPDAPAFRDGMMGLGGAVHDVGLSLLGGCEEGLDLAEGTLTGLTEGAANVTRLLRYLGLGAEQVDAGVLWGEEHTDFNLLTLIAGGRFYDPDGALCDAPDDRAGLYLRTRATAEAPQGHRIRGKAPAGCIVSQVGQQLEILTGGALQATPHVIEAPATPGYERCSLAHFLHVHALSPLAPLGPFRTPEALEAYRPPVLAGTYAVKTLVDIGLAPPDALHRFGYRHYGRLAGMRDRP